MHIADRVIGTVIRMRDHFTEPARRVAQSTRNTSREVRRTRNQVRRLGRQFKETAKRSVAAAGAMATAVGGLAVNTGFSEAFDMEGYKTQLTTAVKDTKLAGKIMADAVKLANKTPFEAGEVIESASILESYSISSKRWLADIADMAGATNKSIDQATEALADGVLGEFERLKEFGIQKNDLMLAAEKKYGKDVVFNTKGQITDQIKLQEILQEEMQRRFKGGADALSKTTKGLWSTVTGVTKTSLAKIIGMNEDGTIRQGSLYEKLKGKIKSVSDTLVRWSEDGTIDRIRVTVENLVAKGEIGFGIMRDAISEVYDKTLKLYNFTKSNFGTIAPIVLTVVGAMIAYKTVTLAQLGYTKAVAIAEFVKNGVLATGATTVNAVTIAQWALNAAMKANPIGLVITAITALITVGILIYKNFDKIKEAASNLWDNMGWLRDIFSSVGESIGNFLSPIKETYNWFDKIFGIGDKVASVIKKIKGAFGGSKGNSVSVNVDDYESTHKPTNYRGMRQYAKGGIARVPSIFGEAGPEIAIPLKKTPRSQSLLSRANSILGNNQSSTINQNRKVSIVNYITVKGNVIGNRQFIDEMGNAITNRIMTKLPILT